MITEMKKYSFLVFHRDYHDFLVNMGRLGVLHVIEREKEEEEDSLEDKKQNLERLDTALSVLKNARPQDDRPIKDAPEVKDAQELIADIEELDHEIDAMQTRLENLEKEISRVAPWGDYEDEDLEKLRSAGFSIQLFRCTTHQFDHEWEQKYDLFIINREAGSVFFLIIAKQGEDIDIDAEPVRPAKRSVTSLMKEKEEIEAKITVAQEKMAALSVNGIPLLLEERERRESDIRLETVFLETQKVSEDKLRILEGWVPESAEEELHKLIDKEDVYSLATPPAEGEEPPVRLKNKKFPRLFEPISKLFDLPNYEELDLTPFFAPFFVLFFGFCLGDAGYGVFFILFAGILKLKAKKDFKPILTLIQYLGVGTILFGLLSGTFFGVNLIDSGYTLTSNSLQSLGSTDVPAGVISELQEMEGVYYENRGDFLEAAAQYAGTESVEEYKMEIVKNAEAGLPIVGSFRHLMQDSLSMFYLSMLIGGLQILFGIFLKIMNITRKRGFRYALSTVGWLVLAITLILYYTGILKGGILNYIFYGLLGISGVLIFLLNNPGVNIFARIGSGLWDSYGMITGVFGDLLSYIRLFALGISSAILGFVFNDISLQLLNVPYIGWLLFLVLLIFGHSINLFMASLGGFIHPMRLTFVEFYKNAGFQGGGKKYKPFVIHN